MKHERGEEDLPETPKPNNPDRSSVSIGFQMTPNPLYSMDEHQMAGPPVWERSEGAMDVMGVQERECRDADAVMTRRLS